MSILPVKLCLKLKLTKRNSGASPGLFVTVIVMVIFFIGWIGVTTRNTDGNRYYFRDINYSVKNLYLIRETAQLYLC